MDRRLLALAALLGLAAWLGLVWAASELLGRLGGIAVLALPLVVALAHRYRRFEAYRPAINLVLLLAGFVIAVTWWLGPAGLAEEGLTARQRTTIRIAAAGLLLLVAIQLASYLDG